MLFKRPRSPEPGSGSTGEPVNLAPLHTKIGQLALENDFLESALTKAGAFGN